MIELSGVTKQYLYGARVLGNTDMRVEDGEIVALLGDKGGGKTTLLKVIAGVTDCEGDVLINGSPVAKKPNDVLMLFDDLAVFKNRSFYYNLAYPLQMRGYGKEETDAIVKAAAEKMGIMACLYEKVRKMPLIDVKRLAVARLFLRKYSVLLVDGIMDGLSRDEAKELWAEVAPILLEKAREGVSVMFATESAEEALSIADRIAVLHYGEIKQVGTAEDIRNNPSNIWAAQALDSDYHFERARLERRDDGLYIVLGVQTPTETADEYAVKADLFDGVPTNAPVCGVNGQIVKGYEGKDIFIGWQSDCFADSGEREEKVEYALRKGDKFLLHTASGIRVLCDEKRDRVCTMPRVERARLYDFASENSLHINR